MDRSEALRYNLICSTEDGRVADWIAKQLVKKIGSEAISAVGIASEPVGRARVLAKLYDPVTSPPYEVLEAARGFARRFGVDIVEAEIVGDIPLEVLLACAEYALSVRCIRTSQVKLTEGIAMSK